MARINIEDSLFKQGPFLELIALMGSRFAALGATMDLFMVAQEFYLKSPNKMIPLNEFERRKCSVQTIESGLAEIRGENKDFVYVFGSEKAFSWLVQKSEAGSVNSEKKTESLKKARAAKKVKKDLKSLNGVSTETERSLNASEPLYSLLSSPSSSSNSNSSSSSNTTNFFIKKYCDLFFNKYGVNPPIEGKERGISKRLAQGKSEDAISKFLVAAFSMPDAWLLKLKHPLNAIESKKNEITVFAGTEAFTTQAQANSLDKKVQAFQTNKSIKNGENF